MPRAASPLTLAQKVQMQAERIAAIDARILHISTIERPAALDDLRVLEQCVITKAPGWEDASLSGYIPEHQPPPPPVASFAADVQAEIEHPVPVDEPVVVKKKGKE